MLHFFLQNFEVVFRTGSIPVSLGNCIGLTELYLHSNRLTGECMTHHTKLLQISITRFFVIGPIPETLGNCIELTELDLYNNKLEGACRIRLHFCIKNLKVPPP